MDWNAVSHCSGLRYPETFKKGAHDAVLPVSRSPRCLGKPLWTCATYTLTFNIPTLHSLCEQGPATPT